MHKVVKHFKDLDDNNLKIALSSSGQGHQALDFKSKAQIKDEEGNLGTAVRICAGLLLFR